jgi:hypothetical protein
MREQGEHVKIQYRQFEDETNLPLIRAGVDLLGQVDLPVQDTDCLNSFSSAIDWKQVSSQAGVQNSEVIFGVNDSGMLTVSLREASQQGGLACHELEVETITPVGCSSLSGLIHTVMSPSFTPGFVGTDWEDVKLVLRSGRQARLVMALGSADSNLLEVTRQAKAGQGRKVQGLLLVMFIREVEFALSIYSQAARVLGSEFDSNGLSLIAVPAITDLPEPMLGLLAVYD